VNRTTETIGDATGKTGWRKTFPKKWTPPAQPCGAWGKKMEQTPEQIMQSAIDAFGREEQEDMAIEEAAELIKAIRKHRRKKIGADGVIDEIADGFVTLWQMRLMYGPDAVDARIKVKLTRLVKLVADQVALNAEKVLPAPKPVKPALCWSKWQDGYILQHQVRWLGFVKPQDGMWMADKGDSGSSWHKTMEDAMRAVEWHNKRFDPVPIWPLSA